MAATHFSGPVVSDNGFSGTVLSVASANVTTLTASSGTITNLLATTLTIGTTKMTGANSAVSGTVSAQLGYMQILVGSTTAYIPLYQSVTL